MNFTKIRIGHGYDAHRFDEGVDNKPLRLGAVTVPYHRGLIAHSDGDVLIHCVCDALLGALGREDIGHHFPDTDDEFKNIDSRLLLSSVVTQIAEDGWQIANVDVTVLAQQPRLSPYREQMCAELAKSLNVARNQINVKATTTETMGFVGRKEGIACYAVALLVKE